jgi:hypothetical protein
VEWCDSFLAQNLRKLKQEDLQNLMNPRNKGNIIRFN